MKSSHPDPLLGRSNIGQPLPEIPAPFTQPFFYASLANIAVYHLVDPAKTGRFLKDTSLVPVVFGKHAVATYNFQLYTAHFPGGMDNSAPENWPPSAAGVTQELELNIVACPKHRVEDASQVSFEQFLLGDEQSKFFGNHRVHVPCDADLAIVAGEKIFGEPKFKTSFRVNLPSCNPVRLDSSGFDRGWSSKWGFRINDPADDKEFIFTCTGDTLGVPGLPASGSAFTEYGVFEGKLIAGRWNILGPMTTYLLPVNSDKVSLVYGKSTHAMRADTEELIGSAPAVAVQTFLSAPAAIQSRAFYP